MPPSEASAPGSIGKNRPWSRRCSFSSLRVTPGSTTQSRSSSWTATIRFIRLVSTETPPNGALTWPSSDVPVPNGMIGTPWAAHSLTISDTSCGRLADRPRCPAAGSRPRSGYGRAARAPPSRSTTRLPKRFCNSLVRAAISGFGQVGGRRGSTRSSIVAAGDNRLTTFNGISGLAKVGLRDMDTQSRQITGEITSSIGQAVKISSIC